MDEKDYYLRTSMEKEIDEFYDILEAEPLEEETFENEGGALAEEGAPTPGAEKAEIRDSVIIELTRGDGSDS